MKRKLIYITDFNHCNIESCKCGWNISMGSMSEEVLNDLLTMFKKYGVAGDAKSVKRILPRPHLKSK